MARSDSLDTTAVIDGESDWMANAAGTSDPRSLVVIQSGTAGPPLYCFHAFSGSVAPYGSLVRHLDPDLLALGFQSIGLVDDDMLDLSIADMAHRFAEEIADDPPEGRVSFLGYSLGGVLAVEVARLVANLLDEPPLVLAVDSDPDYRSARLSGAAWVLAHQVLGLDENEHLEALSTLPRDKAVLAIREAATVQRRLPRTFSLARLHRMLDVCEANERAAAAHRPRPYAGIVLSLRSHQPGTAVADRDSWDGLAERVVRRRTAGDHHSIMTSGSAQLATEIRMMLAGEWDG